RDRVRGATRWSCRACGPNPLIREFEPMTGDLRFAGLLLTVALFIPVDRGCAQQAPAASSETFPMPRVPFTYTGPQPAEGIDSITGTPGRTLGLGTICDDCQLEKFTDECVGRLEGPNFDREGNLWMVSPATSSIYKVTPDGHCSVVAQAPAPNGTRVS